MSRSPYLHALELLAAARASRAAEPECSVTISRNAKQDIQFEVVVRGPSVTDCNLIAQYEADLLTAKYPAGGAVSPAAEFVEQIKPEVLPASRRRSQRQEAS